MPVSWLPQISFGSGQIYIIKLPAATKKSRAILHTLTCVGYNVFVSKQYLMFSVVNIAPAAYTFPGINFRLG